ncbi:hypothetical protein Leryth_019620, partial [Lithospermum erythrorhizon]
IFVQARFWIESADQYENVCLRGVEQHKSEAGVKDTVTSYQHCLSLDDANKQIDQLTRKSPVAAKNAEKQAEATHEKKGWAVWDQRLEVIEKRVEIRRDIGCDL